MTDSHYEWIPVGDRGTHVDLSDYQPLLRHPFVQKMRFREQVALARFRYPGCTHTRLEHSLGTAYLAGKHIAPALHCGEEEADALVAAGLLHDIGHGAYSHVSESVAMLQGSNHEDMTLTRIEQMREEICKCANPDLVRAMLDGSNPLSSAVCGMTGADKLDYILRDLYHCGIKTDVDAGQLYAGCALMDGVFCFKDRSHELGSLLRAWWRAHRDIYLHHQVEIPRAMYQYAMLYHSEETGWNPANVYDLVDNEVTAMLLNSASELARSLMRKVFQGAEHTIYGTLKPEPDEDGCVAVRIVPGQFNLKQAHDLGEKLAKDAGLPPYAVLITVCDGIDRLSATKKAGSMHELSKSKAVRFSSRHMHLVRELEMEARQHFALRVVLLDEANSNKLPPLGEIAARIEEAARPA